MSEKTASLVEIRLSILGCLFFVGLLDYLGHRTGLGNGTAM